MPKTNEYAELRKTARREAQNTIKLVLYGYGISLLATLAFVAVDIVFALIRLVEKYGGHQIITISDMCLLAWNDIVPTVGAAAQMFLVLWGIVLIMGLVVVHRQYKRNFKQLITRRNENDHRDAKE